MRRLWICFVFLGCFFLGFYSEAKYKTALTFSGGGFQTAMFLGMLEGVENQGVHPDVLVSTCGGALAAAIAHVYPHSSDRKKLIESEEFHQFLLSVELTDQAKLSNLLQFICE